jgi:hypothetical protein
MAADQERVLAALTDREPLVPRLVDHLARSSADEILAQPRASGLPRVRPRDALRTVVVARELTQLTKLGDAAGRVQGHALTLQLRYSPAMKNVLNRLGVLVIVLPVLWDSGSREVAA